MTFLIRLADSHLVDYLETIQIILPAFLAVVLFDL